MAAAIVDRCPTASTDVVDFWVLVAFGSPAAIKKRFGVTPRMQDRLAAAAALADRLHGKPIQAIDIDDQRPNIPVFIMPADAHIAIK
jgi:hypothetical protein